MTEKTTEEIDLMLKKLFNIEDRIKIIKLLNTMNVNETFIKENVKRFVEEFKK